MHRLRAGLFAALVAGPGLAGTALVPAGAEVAGTTIYGLTADDRIATISSVDGVVSSVAITGVDGEVIGIDRRPNGGAVHAVAKAADSTGAVYTVDVTTGAATFVADLVTAVAAPTAGACGTQTAGTPIVLDGTDFGFDFNPVADAVRIVSDTGQNLRVLPSARPAGATGATFCDGRLNSGGAVATGIAAAAYTNSDTDPATGTTLYDLDTALDDLVVQNPPNAGALAKVADYGPKSTSLAGFDILGADTAYVALTKETGPAFSKILTIDLTTGATTDVVSLGRTKTTLKGIAL